MSNIRTLKEALEPKPETVFKLSSGDVSASFTIIRCEDQFEAAVSKELIVFQRDVREDSLIRVTCQQRFLEGNLKSFIEFKVYGILGSFVNFIVPDGAVVSEEMLSNLLFVCSEMERVLQTTGCRMTVSVFQQSLSDNEFIYFYTLNHRPVPNRRARIFHSVVTRSSTGLRRVTSGPVSFYKADDIDVFATCFNEFPSVSRSRSDNDALKALVGAQSYTRVIEAVQCSYL